MKALFTISFLVVSAIAIAQPNHRRDRDDYRQDHRSKKHHQHHKKNDYKKGRKYSNHKKDYDYRVDRELSRYEFLRLSRMQQNKLQVRLNFLVNSGYGSREYERRLRSDLYEILSREQYRNWENRAYGNGGNTFIFNFSS